MIVGAATALGATVLPGFQTQTPPDPTKVQGGPTTPQGARSAFETPGRTHGAIFSLTPHQDLHGIITPADLHYERHHGGVSVIDPKNYTLLVHGMVDRPTVFTLDDLKRFPSTSYIRFLECSGNFERNAAETATPQAIAGLTSTSEWTGVPLAVIMREVGVQPRATWFLAEGQDAAVMTRSIPIEKAWDDAILAYAQNGEAIRPANGYPVRLLLPGLGRQYQRKMAPTSRFLRCAIYDAGRNKQIHRGNQGRNGTAIQFRHGCAFGHHHSMLSATSPAGLD